MACEAWRSVGVGVALAMTGCDAADHARDPFRATGELIALSGGDGGAANACVTCHGVDGGGDGQAAPRLAGLPSGYLQKQLDDYATGRRPDAVMTPIARRLSGEDRRKLDAYYAAAVTHADFDAAAPVGARGAAIYHQGVPGRGLPSCATCHGETGAGDAANPPLARQPPAYLAEQLARWSRGDRRNDPRGVMQAISRRLTASEIAAVSAYAAALDAAAPPAP